MKHVVDSCRTLEILQQDSGLLPKPKKDWNIFVPKEGDIAYVSEEQSYYRFDGTRWVKYEAEDKKHVRRKNLSSQTQI